MISKQAAVSGQREAKPWTCVHCGAHLGMIRYNGAKFPLLELYRHAVDMKAEMPAEVDVIAPVFIRKGNLPVRCDTCGQVTTWHEKR